MLIVKKNFNQEINIIIILEKNIHYLIQRKEIVQYVKNEFNSCVAPTRTLIKCEDCRDKYRYYSLNSIIVKNNKRFIIKENDEIEICKECDNIVTKNSKCYFHNNFKKLLNML